MITLPGNYMRGLIDLLKILFDIRMDLSEFTIFFTSCILMDPFILLDLIVRSLSF